ncbi:MAG TPA: amidohydrolase [Frankiaceae bacterium]|nr:amidohydrolase [Frankiaceae bacterium]
MTTTLFTNARVHAPGSPTSFVVSEGRFAWVGSSAGPGADSTVDLGGAFVTPAFVDAHVHTTATGLMLTGLDLHGCASLREALDRVERVARSSGGRPILGTGWDESGWPEGRPPTAAELDRASYGSVVYLARADVHGAVASSALLALCSIDSLPGNEGDGLVRLDAHHVVRRVALDSLRPSQILEAQRAALTEAARLGIGCVHEMSGPDVAGEADLVSLLSIGSSEEPAVDVVAYWGSLGDTDTPARLGIRGAGGDLFCDGSIGSYTAAFSAPYADDASRSGELRYGADEVASHIEACVAAGLQTGFHVIGDRAVETVLDAFDMVAERAGLPAVLAGRHRLEHVEAASPESVARMARLGLVASVQPAFDAEWGGPGGMYDARLGAERTAGLNPYAAFARAGVVMAFGADAPVTPLDPWGGVRAAVHHRTPANAVSPRAAFLAATRGGRRAAGDDEGGAIAVGAEATFAVWDATPLPPRPTDERIAGWSTDAGWSEAGLPDVTKTPDCVRTVVRGRTVWAA